VHFTGADDLRRAADQGVGFDHLDGHRGGALDDWKRVVWRTQVMPGVIRSIYVACKLGLKPAERLVRGGFVGSGVL
jgi:hypothetical protein